MAKGHEQVKVHGLGDLENTLSALLPREAYNVTRGATFDLAVLLRDVIKQNAPVDEGDLKKSIKAKRNRGTKTELSASVIADRSGGRTGRGYHALWVEHGTVKMSAQPYVNPSVEQTRPKIPEYYRERVGVRLERTLAKRKKT